MVKIIVHKLSFYFPALLAALVILIMSIVVMQTGKVIVRAIKYYFWQNTTSIHDVSK